MKKTAYYLLFIVLSSCLWLACTKANEESLKPNSPGGGGNNCDTVAMKYAANIKPILQSACYSCHGNGLNSGGVTLDTYAGVKAVAGNGRLMGAITHASGYAPMPQGGSKLSDCNINKIRGWINHGALNN